MHGPYFAELEDSHYERLLSQSAQSFLLCPKRLLCIHCEQPFGPAPESAQPPQHHRVGFLQE